MFSSRARHTRFEVHPLLEYDPDIMNGGIQLVKLEYFEDKSRLAPLPRNQEIPEKAFGTLTERSILVATSHAWFHQRHPDPEGVKLEIMRKEFFPLLRERYPHTQILIFDDWHSCPQMPHQNQEEKMRFKKCMKHMNSVYCYSDVILFVQAPLPDLDERVYESELTPSEHQWLHFIDTIQYNGGEEEKVDIQKNDIVVGIRKMGEAENLTIEMLKKIKNRCRIFFLKRPYVYRSFIINQPLE